MAKYQQKVIHLQLGEEHFYYGSLKALCDTFGKDVIGITYDSLRHSVLSPDRPYKNKKCIIREGVLIRTTCNEEGEKK